MGGGVPLHPPGSATEIVGQLTAVFSSSAMVLAALAGPSRERGFHGTLGTIARSATAVANMLVMGLVLGQSLMAISTMDILLFAKVSLLYNVLWECIVVVHT